MVVVVGVAGQCNVISVYSVVQNNVVVVVEGSLEVKLPTILTDEKTEVGRAREEKRREEERKSEKRKSQKKEDAGARKGRKGANHSVYQVFIR